MKKIILLLVLLIPFVVHAQFNGFAFKPFVASTDVAPSWTPGTTANDGLLAVNTSTRETWYYNGTAWTEFTFGAGSGTAIPANRIVIGNADSTGVTSNPNATIVGNILSLGSYDTLLREGNLEILSLQDGIKDRFHSNGIAISNRMSLDTNLTDISLNNGYPRLFLINTRHSTGNFDNVPTKAGQILGQIGFNLRGASFIRTFSIFAIKTTGDDNSKLILTGPNTSGNASDTATTTRIAEFSTSDRSVIFNNYLNTRNDYTTTSPVRIYYPNANGKFQVTLPDSLQTINPITNSGLVTLRTALRSLKTNSATAFINAGNSFGAATVLGTNDNNSLAFETNDTVAMTINTAQEVGIGITPSSGIKLRVSGATQVDGQIKARGTGNTFSTPTASEVAFFNTTSSGSSGLLFNNSDELELYGNLGNTVQKWNSTSTTFAGAVQVKIIKYTAAGTTAISTTDYYIRIDATLGAQTYTLPTPTSGRILKFKRLDSNPTTVITFTGTVDGAVNPTTTGGATISALATQYGVLTLIANGTDWDISD